MQGLTKGFKFQLVLWASSSDISLARRHFLLVSVYDLIRGWFSWTLAHWGSKLEKLVTDPERQSTEPCNMKERFHLHVHITKFCPDFKTESIRKLSNYNFQWTKTLYQKINVKFHKMISYTWNFLNFTCVFTILVKFDIYFLGLPWEIVFGVIADNQLYLHV